MPFNGSGIYSPPSLPGSWNPAISGQSATPGDWNTMLADFVSAFDLQICRDGQSTITGNIPFANFKITGLGAATVSTDAVNAGQISGGSITGVADTGAADAYVIAPAVPIAAYAAYQRFQFVSAHANTGASTLAVSSLTAKAIKRPNGDALIANDILSGAVCDVIYDGTNFVLLDGGTNAIAYSMLTTRGDLIRRGASAPQRLALGASGRILTSDGTDAVWAVGGVKAIRTQDFTANDTYTPDANLLYAVIEAVGGGGGGAGCPAAPSANSAAASGGGGAGGRSVTLASAATIGVSQAITIGAAGAAGAINTNGGNGGDTSVGALCIGKGASGGFATGEAGIGGVAGTGDVAAAGAPGTSGGFLGTAAPVSLGAGNGGLSLYGAGGLGGFVTNGTNADGGASQGYGSGGAGAASSADATGAAGSAGQAGYVLITEYCSA